MKQSIIACYLYVVLQFIEIKIKIIIIHIKEDDRERILQNFNNNLDDSITLIISYKIDEIDTNCQYLCWHIYIMKKNWNLRDILQTIYRSRRFENLNKIVYAIKYYLSNNINNREICRIAIKAIFETITILNKKIFSDEKNDETIDDVNLKKWVIQFDQIIRLKKTKKKKNIEIRIFASQKILM